MADKMEMEKLTLPQFVSPVSTPGSDTSPEHSSRGVPSNYGSVSTLGAEASTANLLRIDLEKTLSRHTGESTEQRETWDNKVQFLLSLIGYAVGLGNVWRFPYLTQKNGGGAFLIPYAVMLALEGIPLFYLELAIGQRLRKGSVGSWNQISPYLSGVGFASVVVSICVGLYYNTIMAWCFVYLFQSFQDPLPWSRCPMLQNGNVSEPIPECERSGPTSYFWYRTTLNTAETVESPSYLNWQLAVALLAAWVLIFLCMIKGIKSSGKVVYVTATFPYLVLVIFFFRGVTLHGFERGLEHLFVPEWHKLLDPQVWLDAATQIFYSFGLAFGCLIALASYNPVRTNFVRDTLVVTIADFITSIFTATVVFSILGFKATMAYERCIKENRTDCDFKALIEESASGTGLAFIAFTEAIDQFPVSQLWAVLFFLMLLTLGLDSMFGMLEGAITSLYDIQIFQTCRKEIVCGFVCLASCLLSMCFATSTGPYVFSLFDSFSANIPLLIIAFMECVGVTYFYGLDKLSTDIELMIGTRPSAYWLVTWKYLGPLAMFIILVASLVKTFQDGTWYEAWSSEKGSSHLLPWPWWCQLIAALMICASIIWIPLIAAVKYFNLVEWTEETPAFFPEDELREERNVEFHKTTFVEKHLFGFKD